jgi:hypothetical protein
VPAREAILWLRTTDEEWLETFRLVCHHSPFHLRAQVWQLRDELRDRGQKFEHEELEDTLFELAHELFRRALQQNGTPSGPQS